MSFSIRASACYLPDRSIDAEDLDRRIGLKNGTSRKRYGVERRHYASPQENALYMGAQAARQALQNTDLSLKDIDLLLYASGTSHQALPYNAAGLLAELGGCPTLACMDINATCLSFISALEFSQCAFASGRYRRILIVSSELASVGIGNNDPEIATLFADGAAAFVLQADSNNIGLRPSLFRTYSEGYDYCQIRSGGSYFHPSRTDTQRFIDGAYFDMRGKQLYKLAAREMPGFLRDGLAKAGLRQSDIDYVVPHQASHSALAHLSKRLGFSSDIIINVFATMGNQIAASIPIALHQLRSGNPSLQGKNILLIGSAAGVSLGMGVLSL